MPISMNVISSGDAEQASKSGAATCGRDCLNGYIDRYLKALLARDPQQLPWARNARFTESAVTLKPGDGL